MQSSTLYEPSDKHVEYREYLFKVVMLGDASVGKTCLINRFCHGTFTAKSTATIGVDFKVTSRIIGETTVTVFNYLFVKKISYSLILVLMKCN